MRKKQLHQRLLDAGNVIEFIAKKNWELFQERDKLEQRNDLLVLENVRLSQENVGLAGKVAQLMEISEQAVTLAEEAHEDAKPTKGPDRPNRPKLTDREVKDIRKAYRNGMSQTDLADNYGVNRSTISRLVRGIYH